MNKQTPNYKMSEGFFTDYSVMPEEFPPLWACSYGQDEYGLFADWEIKNVGQRFRWIHPGEFLIGSSEDEEDHIDNRETLHSVTLTNGFWLAESQCTQALWHAITGDNPSRFSELNNSPKRPVENVSWDDFYQAFDEFNKSSADVKLRLPTEAEWEYACRAGTSTPFYFGNQLSSELANFDGNYPYGELDAAIYREQTTPVMSFAPNAWGLYDMHGNVWEWCQDGFHADYQNESKKDPLGAPSNAGRVLRGGGWFSNGLCLRSAHRLAAVPDRRDDDLGLRLSLS